MNYQIIHQASMNPFPEYKYEVWFEYIDKRSDIRIPTDKAYTTDIDLGLRKLNQQHLDKTPHRMGYGSLLHPPDTYKGVYDRTKHHFVAYAREVGGKVEELYIIPPIINMQTIVHGEFFVSIEGSIFEVLKIDSDYFLGAVKDSKQTLEPIVTKKRRWGIFYRSNTLINQQNFKKFFYSEACGIIVRKQSDGCFVIMSEHDDISEEQEEELLRILNAELQWCDFQKSLVKN